MPRRSIRSQNRSRPSGVARSSSSRAGSSRAGSSRSRAAGQRSLLTCEARPRRRRSRSGRVLPAFLVESMVVAFLAWLAFQVVFPNAGGPFPVTPSLPQDSTASPDPAQVPPQSGSVITFPFGSQTDANAAWSDSQPPLSSTPVFSSQSVYRQISDRDSATSAPGSYPVPIRKVDYQQPIQIPADARNTPANQSSSSELTPIAEQGWQSLRIRWP